MYKTPKGTRDLSDKEYIRQRAVIRLLEDVFEDYGGVPLETPTFERRDVLLGKYGEEAETKLVYDLKDYGSVSGTTESEQLALRYDLTVPFVRYVIENGIKKMRRYSIGRVFRRDQPNNAAGRFREFYQADFDILGEDNTSMLTEATLFRLIKEVLTRFGITEYTIYYNYTGNLRAMLVDTLGVPVTNFKQVCSTIDKLDKATFDEVAPELAQRGVTDLPRLRELLSTTVILDAHAAANDVLLREACSAWGLRSGAQIQFTPTLARGLDYYNGLIFEVKFASDAPSVISGGRYDGLVPDSTLIGVSFGISRMIALLPSLGTQLLKKQAAATYYVTSIGAVTRVDKLAVIEWLRVQGYCVLYDTSDRQRKLSKVLADCETTGVTHCIIIAETEWQTKRTVIVKDLAKRTQTELAIT